MKPGLFILLFLISINGCTPKQKEYPVHAYQCSQTLMKWHNPTTGLWETTSWWNAANIITALTDFCIINKHEEYFEIIENSFDICRQFEVQMPDSMDNWICTNFINDYYDDQGWWILAWLQMYEHTAKPKFLNIPKITFEDMCQGWDSVCQGGIYWKKPNIGKGAIQNSLFMLSALRLYQVDKETQIEGKNYFEWAEKTYHWMIQMNLLGPDGLIENGLDENCKPSSGRYYTYNQGVFIGAMLELYKITHNDEYLETAHRIAEASIQNLCYENGILKEYGEPDLNGDAVQFKGIFMRHLAQLYRVDPKENYKTFIFKQADAVWNLAKNKENGEIGGIWAGPFDTGDAARQSAALDCLNAASLVLFNER